MPKCPICDYENPEGTKACRECGSDMAATPPADSGATPEPLPVTPPAGGTAACASCGAENPAEAKFCKSCGKPVAAAPPAPPIEEEKKAPEAPPAAAIACPSCGAENPAGGKFCKACGKSLAEPPAEEEKKAPEPEPPVEEEKKAPEPPPEPVCPKCGAKVAEGMKFCGECGAAVGAPAEEPAKPAAPSGPRLVLNPDDEATVVVLTKDETTLNRSEEADVVLKDGYVSSKHAVITKKEDGYWINDLGSTNGTFIQVQAEILLKPGDVLKIGQTLLRFEE